MRIGIDISQIVYEGTGVSRYVENLIPSLLDVDKKNEYVLFGSSFRRREAIELFFLSLKKRYSNVRLALFPFPPTFLDFLWNRLHIVPIEWFIGPVDVFWSSDWTQPPMKNARGITTIHDVSFLRFPESFASSIINVQKRRLKHVVLTCSMILCDSEVTKRDVAANYNISEKNMTVVYPGVLQ